MLELFLVILIILVSAVVALYDNATFEEEDPWIWPNRQTISEDEMSTWPKHVSSFCGDTYINDQYMNEN